MIWNYIYDFLVQYIFGGYDSNLDYYSGFIALDSNDGSRGTGDFYYDVGAKIIDNETGDLVSLPITLGNWLSTTVTVIIMCLAVFLLIMLVRWVWRLVTSAFLLK